MSSFNLNNNENLIELNKIIKETSNVLKYLKSMKGNSNEVNPNSENEIIKKNDDEKLDLEIKKELIILNEEKQKKKLSNPNPNPSPSP